MFYCSVYNHHPIVYIEKNGSSGGHPIQFQICLTNLVTDKCEGHGCVRLSDFEGCGYRVSVRMMQLPTLTRDTDGPTCCHRRRR